MSEVADIAIVGAGAAGLSLAWHLMERGLRGRRVLLLEPRLRYERDRTFCFFSGERSLSGHRNPFEDLASHRWSRWRVRGEGGWIVRTGEGLAYQHLPADAFYERVIARIERTSGVELRLGARVLAVREHTGELVTDTGTVRAGIVFDSRPRPTPHDPDEITLLQHFEGWHVRADRDVFDPDTATLMDFAVPQDHGIHFFYVLPYGVRDALVEATWFGARPLDDAAYQEAIERYLRLQLGLSAWDVTDRERGVIPMTTSVPPPRIGRCYRIGLSGGMAKPSTGYAFQSIQRYSAAIAERLERDSLPEPPSPRGWRSLMLDRVFLSYLVRYPERAPATFARLFERVEPRLLARFLSDRASAADSVAVMRALPFLPLTLETVRSTPLWLRRR